MSTPTVAECVAAVSDMALLVNGTVTERRLRAAADLLTRMAAVCGPECPKCGHFLLAQHDDVGAERGLQLSCQLVPAGEGNLTCPCYISEAELRDHPDIAASLGLTAPEVK